MKTLKTMLTVLSIAMLVNCEKQIFVETGVLWSDDTYFSANGDWYVAVSEGCYSNDVCAVINVLDQEPILPGKNTTNKFMITGSSANYITAFVYLDVNENGIYDDGYDKLTGYKYNYADEIGTASIAVSAYF